MEEVTFTKRVYALCRKIPHGKVTTYAEIARALNCKAYRAVGNTLKSNPYAPIVPCHRVVRSDGNIGGFKGKMQGKEIREKIKLLKRESVEVIKSKVNLAKHLFRF